MKRRKAYTSRLWQGTIGVLLLLLLLSLSLSLTACGEPTEEVATEQTEEVVTEPTEPALEPTEEPAPESTEEPTETPPEPTGEVALLDKVFYGDTWTWPYQTELVKHLPRGKFYIPVQDDNLMAVMDPDAPDYDLKFVETEFVQPHHPWMAPGMRYNWINFQSEGKGDHDAIGIMDTWTDEIIKYIQTGTNDPFHMAFSPTENLLITADLDEDEGRIHLFDTEAMELLESIETEGVATRDIQITHDGRYAFIGHQGYDPDNGITGPVGVLDIANREMIKYLGEGRCRAGKMTPDGTLVFYSCHRADKVLAIDTSTLEIVKEIETPAESGPHNITFRPDGKFAYVALLSAGQVGVVDMESLEMVKTLDSGTNTSSIYMHPYAPLAVLTNDGTDTHVTILDTENHEIVEQIETDGKGTHNGQWSPDGRWFVNSNRLGESITLMTYNEESGAVEWFDDIQVGFGANGVHWVPYFCGVQELTPDNVMNVVNEVPINEAGDCPATAEVEGDGDDAAASADGTDVPLLNKVFYGDTWTWPYQTELVKHLPRGKFYIPVQDDNLMAVMDPDAPDYDLKFVETEFVQPHHPWMAPGMRYNWINFQSEGKGDHDAIAIMDTRTDEIIKYIQTGTNDPFHMAFSPTENLLITADLDEDEGRIHLFDTEAMELLESIETEGVATRDIQITHDGRYAFIGHQGYEPDNGITGPVGVLDIANREMIKYLGEGRCRAGKMTPDGTLVFYSCHRADKILAIDTSTLEIVKEIEAPAESGPHNITFRPDGKFAYVALLSAGQVGVVDMESLEMVKTLDSGTNTSSIYMHPYAPLAVLTNDGTDTHVTILDTENHEIVEQIETDGKGTHNGQWSPDGRWFVNSNRLGESITLMTYNEKSGAVEWYDDIQVGFGANGVHWAPYFCGVDELTSDNVMDVVNEAPINEAGDCPEAAAEEEEAAMEEGEVALLDKVFYGDTWTWPYQTELVQHLTRGRFYIPVQDDNKMAIMDPDAPDYALTFVETDFVQPHHPWMAPGMRYNWINFQSEGKGDHDAIAIMDTWTNEIQYIQTGTNDPFHMAFSPTENLLVTADLDAEAGRVHLFDTEAMVLLESIETEGVSTRDIQITHDGRYAFIGHQGYDPDNGITGPVGVLDIANREMIKYLGEGRCRAGKMTPDGTLVFYSCHRADKILVIDTSTLEIVKEIETPAESGTHNITFRPDGKFAYVGLLSAGQVGVVDMETLEMVKTLDSGTNTSSIYMHPYAPLAVLTNDGTDTHVTILDTENNEIVEQIETDGKGTHNGQWSPDGRWFVNSNRLGESITLMTYNEESGAVEWYDDIQVGFGANGVHWVPYFCGVSELTPDNVMDVQNLPAINEDGECGTLEALAAPKTASTNK